jgi:catechol 2,3-dioxygenase-like lactoylglutathione lyase family enzyme
MITLEHANLSVRDLDHTLRFILTALPHWRVRGEGSMDWFGRPVRWLHVGDEQQYLALQSGGEGGAPPWQGPSVGVKHLGFIVPDVAAVVARLQAAGWPLDHWGGRTPVRRSAYLVDEGSLQFEFVQYDDPRAASRLEYA